MSKVNSLLSENLAPKRYFAILATTVCLTVLAPLVKYNVWSSALMGVLIVLSLMTASCSIAPTGKQRFWVLSLATLTGLMWISTACLDFPPFNSVFSELITSTLCLLFFVHVCYVMLSDILTGEINSNRICGAVCVYILIGFCFAIVHTMIALANPESYAEPAKETALKMVKNLPLEERYPPFVYFSFCSLSTVGYGDIVPVGRLARTVSWLEAVIGQFYMAVLVARLVGLHTASLPQKDGEAMSN